MGYELLGYWPLDGDYKDYSGNGNDLVPSGLVTFVTGTQYGYMPYPPYGTYSCALGGSTTSNFLDLPSTRSIFSKLSGLLNWTVEFDLYTLASTVSYSTVLDIQSGVSRFSASNNSLSINKHQLSSDTNSVLNLSMYVQSYYPTQNTSYFNSPINSGMWNHVQVSATGVTGNTVLMYLDGNLSRTLNASQSKSMPEYISMVSIGYKGASSNNSGLLRNFKIYSGYKDTTTDYQDNISIKVQKPINCDVRFYDTNFENISFSSIDSGNLKYYNQQLESGLIFYWPLEKDLGDVGPYGCNLSQYYAPSGYSTKLFGNCKPIIDSNTIQYFPLDSDFRSNVVGGLMPLTVRSFSTGLVLKSISGPGISANGAWFPSGTALVYSGTSYDYNVSKFSVGFMIRLQNSFPLDTAQTQQGVWFTYLSGNGGTNISDGYCGTSSYSTIPMGLSFYHQSGMSINTPAYVLKTGVWHWVSCEYDLTTRSGYIYVDGLLKGQGSCNLLATNTNLRFANNANGGMTFGSSDNATRAINSGYIKMMHISNVLRGGQFPIDVKTSINGYGACGPFCGDYNKENYLAITGVGNNIRFAQYTTGLTQMTIEWWNYNFGNNPGRVDVGGGYMLGTRGTVNTDGFGGLQSDYRYGTRLYRGGGSGYNPESTFPPSFSTRVWIKRAITFKDNVISGSGIFVGYANGLIVSSGMYYGSIGQYIGNRFDKGLVIGTDQVVESRKLYGLVKDVKIYNYCKPNYNNYLQELSATNYTCKCGQPRYIHLINNGFVAARKHKENPIKFSENINLI